MDGLSTLDETVDSLLMKQTTTSDEIQSTINPDIFFKYNSVNLVIGKRGSGKTYAVGREALKLALIPNCPYTQIFYITDKVRDDTFERIIELLQNTGIQVSWVKTNDAVKVIQTITTAKGKLASSKWCEENPEDAEVFRQCMNVRKTDSSSFGANSKLSRLGVIPHTLIIFDDCIGLFKKDSQLSKKLFENRQSRITYILILQDVQGISASMKANIDSLMLFGGFPKSKWNILTYQLPPFEFSYYDYAQLDVHDYVFFDYIDNSIIIKRRYA